MYDACVLYPAPLRDLLMHLALTDLFRAKWTDAIHDEWIRNVLKDRPDLKPEQLDRTRTLMNAHVRDCLVTSYEDLIPALTLPDPDDRHVLAAAIRSAADVIVTANLSDFPNAVLATYGIDAQHPDEFIMRLLDLAPNVVFAATKRQRESLKNPRLSVDEFPGVAGTPRSCANSGCLTTVSRPDLTRRRGESTHATGSKKEVEEGDAALGRSSFVVLSVPPQFRRSHRLAACVDRHRTQAVAASAPLRDLLFVTPSRVRIGAARLRIRRCSSSTSCVAD